MFINSLFNKIKSIVLFNYYSLLGYKLILPPQGLGDILILLLGLRKYKEKAPKEKVGIIVTKKHFYDLCKLFSDNVDKIMYLPKLSYFPDYILDIAKIVYGPNSHFDRFEEAILQTIGVNYNKELHILPKIKQTKKVLEMFKSKYKEGKTILITPEATTSQNCFQENYWENVADKLSGKGYIPVFNSRQKYGSYESILLNIEDTITFANHAGNVLGFRSGLNDVLGCFSSAYQVIIYPNNWHKGDMPYLNGFDENPNEKYMEDGSLKRLYQNKQIEEFIFDEKIDVTEYFREI